MDLILTISLNIIIIWWAFMIILWVIALIMIINILSKISYMTTDMKEKYEDIMEKYNFVTWTLFKPVNVIMNFINKVKKNG